jgi:hypothetical protein
MGTNNPLTVFRKNADGTGATPPVFKFPDNTVSLSYTSLDSTPTAFYFNAQASGGNAIYTTGKTLLFPPATPSPVGGLTARGAIYSFIVADGSSEAADHKLAWVEYYNSGGSKYRVMTTPLGGGTPVVLHDDIKGQGDLELVADSTHIYWATHEGSGYVLRVPISNAVKAEVRPVSGPHPYIGNGMAVDATYIYFRDSNFTLYRTRKDGEGSPEPIATLNAQPQFHNIFGVDAGYVYGLGYGGQILRISKIP